MKNIFGVIACMMLFSFSNMAQAQTKIGHVNMQELIQSVPDYKDAEKKLQAYAQDLQKTYGDMQQEYQDLVTKYIKDSTSMTETTKGIKRQAIEDLTKRMQTLEQTSDQKLQDKQLELLKPMQEKVMASVKATAKETGYTYVFDTSNGSALVYYPDGDDITDNVRKKLSSGGSSTGGGTTPAPKGPAAPRK